MYEYNLLVSYQRELGFFAARLEIQRLLEEFGDSKPTVEKTLAHGIIGVKTSLDSRAVVRKIHKKYGEEPLAFSATLKWTPVDFWTEAIVEAVRQLLWEHRRKIRLNEKWGMEVEKRRYTEHHTRELIDELAPVFEREVDLDNPDKVVHVEFIGRYCGVSILGPDDVFSLAKGC